MNARVRIDTGDGSGVRLVRAVDQLGERLHLRRDARDGRHTHDVHSQPTRLERVEVLLAVLLVVDHHEVGCHRRDLLDVRVLRASDLGQLGMFAEARHRDGHDVPREQGLGDGRDEADDPHCADPP